LRRKAWTSNFKLFFIIYEMNLQKEKSLLIGSIPTLRRPDEILPERLEEAGAIVGWRCPNCGRLRLNATGQKEDVVVYKIEKKGNE